MSHCYRRTVIALPFLLVSCTSDPGVTVHNANPRAEITSHADGESPEAGLRTFTGIVEDPDHGVEELELSWLVDGAEACPPVSPDGSGNTSCDVFLESGARTVTLQVQDPLGGIGSDKVTLDVQAYGDPWAEIASPLAGDVLYADQLVDLTGEVGDSADSPTDLEVWWESSLDGVLDINVEPDSSGNVVEAEYLSEGDHQLQLRVRNTGGNESYDTVNVSVKASNTAPTCSIDAPATGSEYEYGETVLFEATVDDVDVPEDWLSATFTSHLMGELGSITPNSDGSVTLPLTELTVGAHNVTMSVADEQGLTCTASVVVSVLDCPTIWHADDDGDGFGDPDSTATGCEPPSGYVEDDSDCDDRDAAVNPDASEICNEVDDDCDGNIDDDDSSLDTSTASTWYADGDRDGYGDAGVSSLACDQPAGYLADNTDCDDADATAYPGAPELCDGADDDCDGTVDEDDALDASTWYADSDGDGYGDSGSTTAACSEPSGYTSDASDCDDADAGINPATSELCDSVDNDCDGDVDEDDATDASTWYADLDGDGYGDASSTMAACSVPSGFVADDTDCDDSRSSVNPAADEYCNGRDDDCDTDTDEVSALDASTWYTDADSDGYGDDLSTTLACSQPTGFVAYGGDCDDGDAAFNPGASESDCSDPADYNCDGSTAYADVDGDGWAACEECDDTDAAINPDAVELCDGADNDCDGTVDEADASDASTWYADSDGDGYGDAGSTALGCSAPAGHVSDATDCDDADAGAYPGSLEYCDGADNNCDGTVDEAEARDASTWYADGDGDGYGDSAITQAACTAPSGYVADATDCDDADSSANPGAGEYCDSVDNDCDGTVDEDDALDATTWYLDADSDGYGGTLYDVTACTAPSGFVSDSSDCNDGIASINPGAAEYCDGADNDCDSVVDEDDAVDASTWYADDDGDGFGDAGDSAAACSQPSGHVADDSDCDDADADTNPDEDEYCDGHDDDCDGDIDEDDAVDADTWYLDSDGDGYGLDASTTDACVQPSGYAGYGGDCDDSDTAYNPGASETDCADPNDYNCDGSTAYADVDGDGWAACEECDDYDYNTNPDADEYCDGHDDDCDGDIDEDDAVDASTWYADVDGDGYGDGSTGNVSCSAPSGRVADGTDQDDADSASYPGAPEIIGDGVDQDGDGGDSCYQDLDSDGYGSSVTIASSDLDCSDSGESTLSTDCDDGDATANPGEVEICNDGVDNDCDGTASGCEFGLSESLADSDAVYTGTMTGAEAAVVAGAGDINGDGFDDILIGAPQYYWTSTLYNFGAVHVVLGSASPTAISLSAADATLRGITSDDYAGTSLDGAGDFNGDGFHDVIIGAYGANEHGDLTGEAYVVLGGGSISGGSLSTADARFYGEDRQQYSGWAVAGAGDYNGDGLDDVVIGAREWTNSRGYDSGCAYLVLGTTALASMELSSAAAIFYGESTSEVGYSVDSAGDVDGDGLSDVLVGDDSDYSYSGSAYRGAVFLFLGQAVPGDVGTSSADAVYTGVGGYVGKSVAGAGDVNGDGFDDMLFGAPSYESGGTHHGGAFLVLGNASPADTDLNYADASYVGEGLNDYFGCAVAGAGDVDGDGMSDVLIGDELIDYQTGGAYLFLGSASLGAFVTSDADTNFYGENSYDWAGSSVAGVGDVNADGLGDFMIGAENLDSSTRSETGGAYLLLGLSE